MLAMCVVLSCWLRPLPWSATAADADHLGALRLATFVADVTPPLGHPLMGGGVAEAREVVDPLEARGLVLLGDGLPLVLVGIDWCEIRNDSYAAWRDALAAAAGTRPQRVMLAALHQHDAPITDLAAQRLLAEAGVVPGLCDETFHARAVERVATALRAALPGARPLTHVGLGQAPVDRVASTRRVLGPDGRVEFIRNSASTAEGFAYPEGQIDPLLRTVTFYEDTQPLASLHVYAVHPMSYYGQGGISADFVGMARARRQRDVPEALQLYFTGCGANVTAGKYNDGSRENRPVLADRLYRAMVAADAASRREAVDTATFRLAQLRLDPREDPGYREADQRAILADAAPRGFERNRAALGLSFRQRVARDEPLDVPSLELGSLVVVLLPGETFVEYQLAAQRLRPDRFVVTLGYGDAAGGYLPPDRAFEEGGGDLADWCWVAPPVEPRLTSALREALGLGE